MRILDENKIYFSKEERKALSTTITCLSKLEQSMLSRNKTRLVCESDFCYSQTYLESIVDSLLDITGAKEIF